MRIAYISGPYRADSDNAKWENMARARRVARDYWMKGYAVICPHMNTWLMDGQGTTELFIEGDKEFLRRMTSDDLFILLPSWRDSEGACQERDLAKQLGIPIEESGAI